MLGDTLGKLLQLARRNLNLTYVDISSGRMGPTQAGDRRAQNPGSRAAVLPQSSSGRPDPLIRELRPLSHPQRL